MNKKAKPPIRVSPLLSSLIDPARDIIDGGDRESLCLNSGMMVAGRDGIGLCPLGSPPVSLGEPAGKALKIRNGSLMFKRGAFAPAGFRPEQLKVTR